MNRAFEAGSKRFPWWPDWRGECAAIVASGPSVKDMDLSSLKDRIHVVAIKENVNICPWADAVYGCDAAWWIDRKGLSSFQGLKFYHGITAKFPGLHRVEVEISKDAMLLDDPLKVGNGGNSAFQALNLIIQFGVTDIILIGVDCHDRGGMHWYGRNKWLNANNPMPSNFRRWITGFEKVKSDISKRGITVVNASSDSDLKCFRKTKLPEIMEEWGL